MKNRRLPKLLRRFLFAAFLLSDLASGMTAEITYVDGGFSQTAGLSADQV